MMMSEQVVEDCRERRRAERVVEERARTPDNTEEALLVHRRL